MNVWIRPATHVLASLYFAAAVVLAIVLRDSGLAFVPTAVAGGMVTLWAGTGLLLTLLAAGAGAPHLPESAPVRKPWTSLILSRCSIPSRLR